MVYCAVMNTIAATWSWGLRERIGGLGARIERLGQRMSAWAKAKKRQMTEDDLPVVQLSEKAKKRLAKISDEIDAGTDLSPAFSNTEDAIAYLHEEARKYREEEGSQ